MKTTLLKLSVVTAVLAFGALSAPGFIPNDADGDGVPDSVDVCPGENSSSFDRNGDGCIDAFVGARHIEYWGVDDPTITYVINDQGAPNINDGSDLTAIQSAVGTWTAIPNTGLNVVYGGTTTQANSNGLDRINLVTFVDNAYQFSNLVLAVGLSTSFDTDTTITGRVYRKGEIFDTDMIFNPSKTFKTGVGPGVDIQSVATHEAGHLFGLSHSAIQSSTMFYVLPGGLAARSLETDDRLTYFKAYGTPGALASSNRLDVQVNDGQSNQPVPGAIVFVVDAVSQDTVGCDYTLPNGHATFPGLANGSYFVSIYPLNGTSPIGFIAPGNINTLVADIATDNFVPEWYDAAESNQDNPIARTPVSVSGGSAVPVAIVTNVDVSAPSVVAASPGNGAIDVAIDGAYRMQFSEPVDVGTLNAAFSFRDVLTNAPQAGSLAVLRDDSVVVFIPSPPLAFSKQYRLRFDTDLHDKFGNPLASDFTLDVTTEAEPALSMTSLAPSKGVTGTTVVINGQGFDVGATVSFGGVPGTVTSNSPRRLVTSVPVNAATGLLTVTNPDNSTSNSLTFTLLTQAEVARGFETGQAPLSSTPNALALTPDGDYAYVATSNGIEAIVVNPNLPDYLLSTHIPVSAGFDDIATLPSGKRVYAVSKTLGTLVEVMSDPTTGLLFNTILSTRQVGANPVSIVIDPTGDRAYVATNEAEVQVWDMRLGSPTYRQQIGVIPSPLGVGVTGAMAMTPSGSRLAFATDDGNLLLYNPATQTIVGSVAVGLGARAIAIDPQGERGYVTHDSGEISVVNLQGPFPFQVQDIATGGSPRGLAITPGASYLYATDRGLDQVKVVDLVVNNATFRTVVADVPASADPVDMAISPDGFFAFSVLQGDAAAAIAPRMMVSAIGSGPALQCIHPIAGPVGTIVVLRGQDLGDEGFDVAVRFNGVLATNEGGHNVNESVVRVPSGATSGPVTVETTNSFNGEVRISNPVSFQVLETQNSGMRFAATLEPNFSPGEILEDDIVMSPKGDMVYTRYNTNTIRVYDVRPGSTDFHRQVTQFTAASTLTNMDITADGKTLFYGGFGNVGALVSDPHDPNFGQPRPFMLTGFGAGETSVWTSPNNVHLLVYDGELNRITLFDAFDVVHNVPPFPGPTFIPAGFPRDVAFDPSGRAAYVLEESPPGIQVIDTDALSGTFGVAVQFMPLSAPGGFATASLAVDPEGIRLFIFTIAGGGGSVQQTFCSIIPGSPYSLNSPVAPTVVGNTGPTPLRHFRILPSSTRAVRSNSSGFFFFDLNNPLVPIGPLLGAAETSLAADFAFTPDGRRMYVASRFHGHVRVYDFANAAAFSAVSGNNQTGVGGAILAAPIRVRVTHNVGSGAQGTPGVPVSFYAESGNGFFDVPCDGSCLRQEIIVATDANGYADAKWWLYPGVGPRTVTAYVDEIGFATFDATAVPDPNSLPLAVAEVIPLDNTNNVSVSTAALVTFSREIDPSTIDATSLFLQTAADATLIPVAVGFTGDNHKVSLTPLTPLVPSTSYQIVSTAGVHADNGDPLSNPGTTAFETQAPPPLTLRSIAPPSALPGAQVVISGTSFNGDGSTVNFGARTAIGTGSSVSLLVTVPADAAPGLLNVTVTSGGTSNIMPFTVLQQTTVPIDEVIATIGTVSGSKSVAVTGDGALCYSVGTDGDVVIPVDIRGAATFPAIPVGDQPVAIAIDPSSTLAYVANFNSGTVSVIDVDHTSPTFNTVVETIAVGTGPIDLAILPDGDRVIVANVTSRNLSVIDADHTSATFNQVTATIGTTSGSKSVAVSGDGTRIFLGSDVGFVVMEANSYSVTATIGTASGTKSVAVSPDGTLLFVLLTDGNLLVVDVHQGSQSENQVLATIGTGSGTKGVAVSGDGTLLYLVQENSDEVVVVALEVIPGVGVTGPDAGSSFTVTYRVVDTIPTGDDPSDIALDPTGSGNFVVANEGAKSLTLFGHSSPVPTRLKSFVVTMEDGVAVLRWETSFESGMQGYDIVRSQQETGRYDDVTKDMVRASGSASGGSYVYRDETVAANRTYWYKLREVADNGLGAEYGPYSVTFRLANQLDQNVPNPFNPTTAIHYAIASDSPVTLTIYDVAGRRVRTLVNEHQRADAYRVAWDGSNDAGQKVASGVYFYRLVAGKFTQTKKMVLLK